ncbi:uncharacterized protein LAJ45_07586 [Morchella importuna]|uniref:Transcription and mRNA export factor SUS1 n=1 Tax=Morchella conica CCBAS932 TaxID=1392247 RepID=A0A3N4L2A5_9PEZI|nr:uncharacterized protein LAJ45_07586 [Morchella importuna]KAH8148483.1 hypothetical protein LAJ45_07586 [Morchella importuna]RPB15789.1 hypothetical protein P167DRAFT_482035 [Morchella conica CCBAS932]
MSSPTVSAQGPALRAEINRRLLDSGELERLETLLLDLLRESGWYEDTKKLCHERLRAQDAKIGNFNALVADVEGRVKETVPEGVKVEVVKAIKKVLESMIE